ncbi:MAG TPA: hypothetical protein VHW47_05635 [Acidimicrobiales bacterium]|jgi:hypothetical protein|nr:hypothetical protein [Acidimicrobiales bacterium]
MAPTSHPPADLPPTGLPLSALLSMALVAYMIELDNEFEHRMSHRTTTGPAAHAGSGPWLVSVVMWWNCMRFVDEEGLAVGELRRLARTGTNLDGMRRWGYLTVDGQPGKPERWTPGMTVRATRAGLRAREIWPPLIEEIEDRWRARFGAATVDRLRQALSPAAAAAGPDLPDCMPILGYGLFTTDRRAGDPAEPLVPLAARPTAGDATSRPAPPPIAGDPALPVLLARVLLALALEFEAASGRSLPLSANLLRPIGVEGARVRDLPALAGVSKAAVAVATGLADRRGLGTVGPAPGGGRWKVFGLSDRGQRVREEYPRRLAAIEAGWAERFGRDGVDRLRAELAELAGDGTASRSPLFAGLHPHRDGWRASVRPAETLPHFPMVLHRGGYPDGS